MRYDVVMLGRGCESFFDEKTERLLTEFVAERGGGLVFSRGKAYGGRFAPLAKLEPVAWSDRTSFDLKLAPTAAGRDSPVLELAASDDIDDLIERLPSFDQARVTTGEKPLAVVLAEAGAGGPGARTIVMAYHRYGQGKVLTVNGSGLWRWAFRDRGKDEDELVYGRFWIAVLRWMIAASDILPGANVALRSERRYYTDEQPMRFLISTRGLETGAYRPRLVIENMSEGDGNGSASSGQRKRSGPGRAETPGRTAEADTSPRRGRFRRAPTRSPSTTTSGSPRSSPWRSRW